MRVARAVLVLLSLATMLGGASLVSYKAGKESGRLQAIKEERAAERERARKFNQMGVCEWFQIAPPYYGCTRES